jgi:hypothetical protein
MAGSRYLVGIDLGTTNTACAFVDTQRGRTIEVFQIPQLTGVGRVEALPTLPSFVYLAGAHELPAGALDLPWASGRDFCVGTFAREQGARVPGRLVASSKSWLCHGGVDRTAAILPWGAADDVARISPVDASARIVRHVREAWDASFPEPLAEQDVVLTVPASFDAVARELTVEAAHAAGLERLVLLEEPQAAFYAWLVQHETGWREAIARHPLVLVVDVGGGTTDLSLMAARHGRGELAIERVAVGDHLLLGGDNMDVALARRVEGQLGGGTLDAQRFHVLVGQCRGVKEAMLADGGVTELAVTVPGRGGRVIGGALTSRVSRDLVLDTVVEGFFPRVGGDERPARGSSSAELGLPYAADTAITRHVADFLARHHEAGDGAPLARPDALLFNGGACEPELVRERVADVVGRWHDASGASRPAVLEAESLQLAVARGAAYYGLVRRGHGVRIGSGTARTYYLGLDDPAPDAAEPFGSLPRAARYGRRQRRAARRSRVLAGHQPSGCVSLAHRDRPHGRGRGRGARGALRCAHRASADSHRAALRAEARGARASRAARSTAHRAGHAGGVVPVLDDGAPLAARVPLARHGERPTGGRGHRLDRRSGTRGGGNRRAARGLR